MPIIYTAGKRTEDTSPVFTESNATSRFSTFFETKEDFHAWRTHILHTDGFKDAIGGRPKQAEQVVNADLKAAYNRGYTDGLAYLREESQDIQQIENHLRNIKDLLVRCGLKNSKLTRLPFTNES